MSTGDAARHLVDVHFGKRRNELAAAPPVLRLLLEDLVAEIPRQQDHVVRLILEETLGRDDWDVRAR